MTDLAQLSNERIRIVGALHDGDGKPLADHLDGGGELFEDQREALIKYLRGELPLKRRRGRPRTFAQKQREISIRYNIRFLQRDFAMRDGSRGSLQKAYEAYLDHDPTIGPETLRNYVEDNGGGISDSEKASIDETRAKVLAELKATTRRGN